jgi:hypothetical protein
MRIVMGLIVALALWAMYLIGNLTVPTPDPVQPANPSDPYVPVCPTPTAVHHAVWPQRGAPCPAVTTTTTGGEGT